MRVLMMANNNSETPVAETAQYPSCNFNESMPNYLADNLSVYLGPCEPVPDPEPEPECVPDPEPEHVPDCEPEPCNNVGKPNICNIDALVDPLDSNVLTVLCDLKDTCGKGTANKIDDVKRSSNRRNRRKSSSNQKKNTKLAARKNRRSSGKRPMVDLFAADFGKGQRSNLVRRARLSVWGFGGKIDEIFKQNAENKADIKGRTVRTDSANKSILISKGEFRASNKGLLVKLKLGSMGIQNCQLNTIPDMDKDLESYREVKLEPSNLQSDVKEIVSLKSRIAEKEGIENRCLDLGTSPDSEVINVIPDTQINGTSTTEEIRVSSKDCISLQSDDCGIHSPEIVNDASLCEKQTERSPPSMSMASFHQTEVSVSMDMLTVESVIKAGIESMESQFNGQHFQINLKSNSSVNKNRANCSMENNGKNKTYGDTETHPVSGNLKTNDAKALEEGSRSTSGPLSNSTMVPHSAWVCCDDCHKWRRIPTVLADSIESTKCRWICKDNMDKEFADCSIPQEKSNADINEELELSEASCEEDACNNNTRLNSSHLAQKQPTDPPQLSWKLIKTNLFLHRNRKNQPIDEVMVCHCKPPIDGRMGCRDECLNRMLNIECVKGTCPCGDFCSNQQFQKRKYSKLKCVPSGKKGCGLQLQEDIPKGRFLIEYVGEVLDMPAYEARQKEYASKGHKHFYFMTLNGSEVIDACAKGNLGRFINHSCEPNCRTEKWMVNGEVCIGLFAIRDINKGEELTFDYNYVRVFGAAAKKCICGSSRCRGVIGGDPLNDETVVLDDSDDEYSEPVPFNKENNNNLDNSVSITVTTEETNLINDLETNQNVDSATLLEVSSATSASESKVEYTEGLLPSFVQPVDTCIKVKTEIKKQSENTTSVSLLSEDGDCKKKSKSHSNDKKCTILKPKFYSKINSSPSATKKGKSKSKQIEIDTKPPQKPKKIVVDNLTGRFEAVEEALNILLTNGGISKRRDAWKGYLTLLGLTALGGNGEGIQSNRDLSMILDALLRTKSRTVLVDIINKNGLQMLHILLKRYRKVFNKTPILRKLLKVLEYLAETKILTVDKILKSSQLGVESFKESILSLTEHADKEVHHIARNFRDRYIPRSARRVIRAEWDIDRMEYQQKSNLTNFPSQQLRPSEIPDNTIKQSISPVELPSASCVSSSTGVTRIRKRKSRWDQPGDVGPVKKEHQTKGSDPMDVDAPPGFSFSPPSTATDQCKTVTGRPQDRYVSRLPTAFGLPCSLFKNLGIQARDGEGGDGWIVAPGLTFHPFPPLPSYVKEEESWRNRNFQRDRNINTLGKRYFKQQKWNYSRSGGGQQWNHPSKYGPVGFNGPNRDRPNMGVGYGGNEGNGTYNTGNNYYQQQQ